jgi:hypothetical protein
MMGPIAFPEPCAQAITVPPQPPHANNAHIRGLDPSKAFVSRSALLVSVGRWTWQCGHRSRDNCSRSAIVSTGYTCYDTRRRKTPAAVAAHRLPYDRMMTLDLTDDEKVALVRLLRHAIDDDPFPHAPRLDPLKTILAKLEPAAPQPERLPPLRPGMGPRVGRGRRQRS